MPLFGVIQIATLLDMARVGGNGCIGHSQKALGNDSSYFEAVEVLMSYLRQNSLQGGLDLFGSEGPKEHHLHLCSHEKESPANGMDLSSIRIVPTVRVGIMESSLRSTSARVGPGGSPSPE